MLCLGNYAVVFYSGYESYEFIPVWLICRYVTWPWFINHSIRKWVSPWEGVSLENGSWVCAALKTPFSHPPDCSIRSHFKNFQFFKTLIFMWNHNFLKKICILKSQNWEKFIFKPKKLSNFSSQKPQIDTKNNFLRPKIRQQSPFKALIFWPIRSHTRTKIKVEYPLSCQ